MHIGELLTQILEKGWLLLGSLIAPLLLGTVLVTNEFAFHNPLHPDTKISSEWRVNSGSLFMKGGRYWTGVPDFGNPGPQSEEKNNSAIFRLITARNDFQDVAVRLDLEIAQFSSTPATPAAPQDGVMIFLRYRSEQSLYYVAVARRDHRAVIKKKCPGGPSNDGTYHELSPYVPLSVQLGERTPLRTSIKNQPNGNVQIELYVADKLVLWGIDAGKGCDPIRQPGSVGIRGDNAEFYFDNFKTEPL